MKESGNAIWFGWIEGDGETPEQRRANGRQVDMCEHEVLASLHSDAAKALPALTRYEIRRAFPLNFGRTHGLAWYHHPDMERAPSWPGVHWKKPYEDGYALVERFVTPITKGGVS